MGMVLALASLLAEAGGPRPLQIASRLVLLPWIAASTRRLRDAGLSPWWQLIGPVPVAGIVVLLSLFTYPSRRTRPDILDPGREPTPRHAVV